MPFELLSRFAESGAIDLAAAGVNRVSSGAYGFSTIIRVPSVPDPATGPWGHLMLLNDDGGDVARRTLRTYICHSHAGEREPGEDACLVYAIEEKLADVYAAGRAREGGAGGLGITAARVGFGRKRAALSAASAGEPRAHRQLRARREGG